MLILKTVERVRFSNNEFICFLCNVIMTFVTYVLWGGVVFYNLPFEKFGKPLFSQNLLNFMYKIEIRVQDFWPYIYWFKFCIM